MQTGTISFNGRDLSAYGRCSLTIQRSAQPPAPARPTHWQVTLRASISIDARMPATARARVEALQTCLDVTEGELTFQDENGTAMSWIAQPSGSNIADILRHGHGVMQLDFTARQELGSGGTTAADATFRPHDASTDGSGDITLHRVHSWQETVKTARSDERAATRKLTTTTISLQAQTAWADTSADYHTRLAWLHERRNEIRAMDTREGTLTRGSFQETVQVESIRITTGGNAEYLDISIQCRFARLPGSSTAEVEYTVQDTTDWATGKLTRTLHGTVEALDTATARLKADALASAYLTQGFRLRKKSVKEKLLDGEDQKLTLPAPTQYDIDIELSQYIHTTWKLTVDSDENPQGATTTYSGTVTSASLATALAKAEEIGNHPTNPHPALLSSKTTVETTSDPLGPGNTTPPQNPAAEPAELVKVSFTYTYATATTGIRANITQENATPAFADHTTRISGEITAPTEAEATAAARSYIPAGTCLREHTETSSSQRHADNTRWTKTSFSYSWRTTHTPTTLKYTETFAADYRHMTGTRTLAGTAWAENEATAEAAILSLLATPLPHEGKLIAKSISTPYERCTTTPHPATAEFLQKDFTLTIEENLTGETGHDIIEAKWSLERLGMVDHTPITPVPCGMPVRQTLTGSKNVGQLTASGSCTARQQATARTWGQSKRAMAITHGTHSGAELPPRERMEAGYKSFDATTPTTFTFSFTYSARYADGLLGIWPATGADIS